MEMGVKEMAIETDGHEESGSSACERMCVRRVRVGRVSECECEMVGRKSESVSIVVVP